MEGFGECWSERCFYWVKCQSVSYVNPIVSLGRDEISEKEIFLSSINKDNAGGRAMYECYHGNWQFYESQ